MKTGKLMKKMFVAAFILAVSCLLGTVPVHADDYHFAKDAEISADELAFIQGTMPGDFEKIFFASAFTTFTATFARIGKTYFAAFAARIETYWTAFTRK